MTFFGMALLTAAGTIVLAAFAIVTARYAGRAFLKQSQEVAAIERQVADGAELTRQQAELIRLQSGQLELQREQAEEQRKTSAKQSEVLGLQARELAESLDERKREAEDRRRAQAAQVTAWFAWAPVTGDMYSSSDWGATVRNASNLPVVDVRVTFNYIAERANGLEWDATPRGTLAKPVRVMSPTSERHLVIPSEVRDMIKECSDEVYAVSITFTDAAGNRWERDAHGALNPRS